MVGIQLWFLYNALLHNVTYLCMKFKVTSFNTFEVMPQTRFRDAHTGRQTDGRHTYRQTDRVTPVYPPQTTDRQGDSSIPPPPKLRRDRVTPVYPPPQTSFVGV